MFNIYDFISDHPDMFKQYKVNELLFVEYNCIIEETKTGYWSHKNAFVYIVEGKKRWKSLDKEYLVDTGDALFIKKGAYIAHQYFDEEFCALLIFVPDDFIRQVMHRRQIRCPEVAPNKYEDAILRLDLDAILSNYFHSVLHYFPQSKPPPKDLLELKFEELILNILSGTNNKPLAAYLKTLCDDANIPLGEVMEENFAYNLKLEDFARLSGRSLSTFKRDFINTYGTSPGKWLTDKRLEYGKYLLETTHQSINEITFDCGYEDPSHFIKIFREKFGASPLKFRESLTFSH